MWNSLTLETIWQDIRYGLRMLAKSPGFAAVAILTLALGIGANTAIFSIVNAVLLQPLPYKDSDRLVAVWQSNIHDLGYSKVFPPYRDFQEWKQSSQSFEDLEACNWAKARHTLTWQGKGQVAVTVATSAGFFSMLGASAEQGRTFEPRDLQNGCSVVVSHRFWQNRLGASKEAVGSALTLDEKSCTIVGVMPRGFDFYPRQTDLWTLITPQSDYEKNPLDSVTGVIGRLKPGVSLSTAQSELAALHRQVVSEATPGSWIAQFTPVVNHLQEELTWLSGRNLRSALQVLLGAVFLVLLIACVNVASLLLGRASERQKELAVRAALGSSRSRLVRQLLTESILLSALGAILGAFLAVAAVRYFRALNPIELPPGSTVAVNLPVLAFTAFLAILTGLLFGLLPAWKASRQNLNETLRQEGRGASRNSMGSRAGKMLVIADVSLSLILLAGAGLLIESTARLSSAPLGFRAGHLLSARISLPASAYPKLSNRAAFCNRLISTLNAVPGVDGVALTSSLPLYVAGSGVMSVQGRAAPPLTDIGDVRGEDVSADYFKVMGIPLIRGRAFDAREREESQPVTIVNEAIVREYFPDQDPIGRQIKFGRPGDTDPWMTIVGVVGDIRRATLYQEMGYVTPPVLYRPLTQDAENLFGIVIRTTVNPLALASPLQREVSNLDSGVPVFDVLTMEQRVAEFLSHPQFRAILLGMFAGLALVLAAVGIFGVLSQLVSQRTREIGIRMALGADRRDVLNMVVKQGAVLILLGVALGLVAALALNRLLSTMLYGVRPTDPFTFTAVTSLLVLVAMIACYLPARRATKVDPMIVLRHE